MMTRIRKIESKMIDLELELSSLKRRYELTSTNLCNAEMVIKALLKHFGLEAEKQPGYVIKLVEKLNIEKEKNNDKK